MIDMRDIKMVDLHKQYLNIKEDVDEAIQSVIDSSSFVNGSEVEEFSAELASYNGSKYVIPCANGTDALQIALMALELKPGDEVLVPAFTYVASVEVIALLGLTPVMVDVDYNTFNVTVENLEKGLSPHTKAIIPVHLFGQSCPMESILAFAEKYRLYVIEDNAQAIGSYYQYADGHKVKTGAMGHIGCTSFFPSKNLGCFGDGGALFTNDDRLAKRIKMIANHGQQVKYHHEVVGCNSRLDTIQAAILRVKLRHLDQYGVARHRAAQVYTEGLENVPGVITPLEIAASYHVYHQYTLKVLDGKRDALKAYLAERGIPSMIYYPLPLQEQEAFQSIAKKAGCLGTALILARSVLSLPMHSELGIEEQQFIINSIKSFYK